MKNKEFRFKSVKELMSWLQPILEEAAQLFEEQYTVELKKFEQSDYRKENAKVGYLFKLILMIVNKVESWHTHQGLIAATKESKELWGCDAFIYLAREIIKVSQYTKNTKDSKRPNSKKHIESKKYLIDCPKSDWKNADDDFQKLFNWVIQETHLPISIKKTTPAIEDCHKQWWVAVNVLILDGIGLTKAREMTADSFAKSDIRKQYGKVDSSNWAKGAGLLTAEFIYDALKLQELEINVGNIKEKMKPQKNSES